MQKTIIYIILLTLIDNILRLLGLSDNEIDFIEQLFNYAFDYLYDYIYDLFKHYIYPKIIKHIKRCTAMVKEYIIDVKSRMW